MKRVLFVDHVDRILGGAEINLIELIEEAQRHTNWQIAVACRRNSALSLALDDLHVQQFDYGFDSRLNQLRFVGATFPWSRIIGGMRALNDARSKLARIVATFEPTSVVSCTNKDHFVASRLAANSIWWVNDLVTEEFFPLPVRLAFRRYSTRASRLIAVSSCVKNALLKLGISEHKISVIHNGIPLHKYQGGKKGAFRAMNKVSDNEPVFGLIGRIAEWKGHALFEQIAATWSSEGRPGRFFMIGSSYNEDQSFMDWLERAARHAEFASAPYNMKDTLADLDTLFHTSLRPEPFGRVIIEAMAAGVPVIAADSGGPREIITDDVDGLLAKTGDLLDYTRKLRLLTTDPEFRQRLITRARQTVEARFTIQKTLGSFEALLA